MKRQEEHRKEIDRQTVDSHLALFRSLSEQELADAEARASRRFRAAPARATTVSVEEAASGRSVRGWRLGLIGVAVAIVLAVFLRAPASIDAPAMFEDAAGSRKIEFGEVVRSGDVAGSALVLADSSRVEMRATSELLLERAEDGVRILLHRGGIIVNAAKQHNGHLYVKTADVTVSVVGTVFLVNAEEEGSRVAVIEGEVRVQQGATKKTLMSGEQVMTKPLMEWQPVSEEISWSRQAEAHLVLLQQSAVPTRATRVNEIREAFEVASVRPSSPTQPGGGARGTRGAGGGGARFQIDPNRFVATNATLHRLILLAYGIKGFGADPVYGGPGWIRSDQFDIQALMPEGSPSYTMNQLLTGDVPRLQVMIQTLLADRFKVALHREMKEMPVYDLVVLKAGKMRLSEDQTPVNPAAGLPPFRSDASLPRGTIALMFTPLGGRTLSATAMPISAVTGLLGDQLGRVVIDKTNLKGLFDIRLEFALEVTPDATAPVAPDPTGPYLFTAIQDQLGLKLESTRGLVEILVIDHVEKLSD